MFGFYIFGTDEKAQEQAFSQRKKTVTPSPNISRGHTGQQKIQSQRTNKEKILTGIRNVTGILSKRSLEWCLWSLIC